jgi:glycosyltransferase involved in cell wall biosynthesis
MGVNGFGGRRIGRRRIVHVTRGLAIGGQEKLLVEFARRADRARFELYVISLTGRGLLGDALENLGVPVTALEEPEGLRPGLVLRLAKCFRRLAPTVIHTHDDKPLVYGAWAARLARVPSLIHTKHYARLPQNTSRQTALLNAAARLARHVVCVSQDSARAAIAQGMPENKVTTIWNGIDLARFSFAGPDLAGPVTTVARLSPEKNIATLLRAAAEAVRQEPAFHLDIAGGGPCRAELDGLVDALSLRGHVRFLGEVGDIPGLLRRSRFFVLPSITEGISLTLLEAMGTGLAVVATAVGGNPEVVVPGETGLLVPAQNPAALAESMLQLWRDPEHARRLGRVGRQRVEENFDAKLMVAKYEALYLKSPDVRGNVGVPYTPAERGFSCTR